MKKVHPPSARIPGQDGNAEHLGMGADEKVGES
jgi:hypothetical protein